MSRDKLRNQPDSLWARLVCVFAGHEWSRWVCASDAAYYRHCYRPGCRMWESRGYDFPFPASLDWVWQ